MFFGHLLGAASMLFVLLVVFRQKIFSACSVLAPCLLPDKETTAGNQLIIAPQ
jgi:hypothetical protein